MKSKHNIKLWCTILTLLCLLVSCKPKNQPDTTNTTNTTPPRTIAVSIAPIEMILKEIVGSNFTIKTIISANISPHTYDPSPADIQTLNSADVVFYVANDMDGWISNLTKNTKTKKIELMELVTKNKAELPTSNHNHQPNEEIINHHAHNHGSSDPHFWTAPLCVRAILNDICEIICNIDSTNAKIYRTKTNLFIATLDSTHNELASKLASIKDKPIFTAHNSFGYFIREFKLTNGGTIEESPGKEIAPMYMINIIDKIKKAKVNRIFSEPQLNIKIIQTIASEANIKVDTLFPLNPPATNQNYVDFVKRNANILLRLNN